MMPSNMLISEKGRGEISSFFLFFKAPVDIYLNNIGRSNTSFMSFGQKVCKFLVRRLSQGLFLPQIWCQVRIGLSDRGVSSLSKITERASGASSRGITVLDTSHLEQLLGNRRGDDTGTARRRNQAHLHRPTLASDLAWHRMGLSNLVTPVTTSNRYYRQLGQNDRAANSSGYFLGALYSQSNVAITISNGDKSLETVSLLMIFYLYNFVIKKINLHVSNFLHGSCISCFTTYYK